MKKRNINIDLIKCVAVFSVISVHFFANVGLYKNVINSTNMYIGIFFRTLFMICVPLFIITTGYLMKNKTLSKKYYLGVLRVLIIYLLDAFIYLGYNTIYNGESFSIRHIIKSILNFDIGYSWYLNKYLNILLFFIVLIISSIINLYFSKGNYFVWGIYNDWGSIFNVLTSVLVFIFVINLNLNKINSKVSRIISKISELSLGMYLTSSVVDDFLYFNYFKDIDFFSFKGYFKIVPLVLILSISLSIIINIIYKIIDKYIVKRLTKYFIK